MMKIINIVLLVVMCSSLFSCFDDKGSYDYTKINEITAKIAFIGPDGEEQIAPSYVLDVGESVKILPKLTFSQNKENIKLEYKWLVDTVEMSTDEEFIYSPEKLGYKKCALVVSEQGVGREFYQTFNISVQSKYKTGWFVLSDEGNGSVLSLIRTSEIRGDYTLGTNASLKIVSVERNIYEKINGEALGGTPVKLHEHWCYDNYMGEVVLLQNGGVGSVELNGDEISRVAYLKSEFLNQDVPANLKVKDAFYAIWDHFILDESGLLYVRRNTTNQDHYSGYFLNRPFMNGKKFSKLIPVNVFRSKYFLAFDADESSYIGIDEQYYNVGNSGKKLGFSYIESQYRDDFEHVEGIPVYSTASTEYDYKKFCNVVVFDVNGESYLHIFKHELSGNVVSILESKRVKAGLPNVNGITAFRNTPYAFYSGGDAQDKLYWLRLDNGDSGLYYDFKGEKITSVTCREADDGVPYPEPEIGIGTESGNVYISKFDEEVKTGNFVKEGDGFGKVKSLIYKEGQNSFQ